VPVGFDGATPEISWPQAVPNGGDLQKLPEAAGPRELHQTAATHPDENQREIFFLCPYNGYE
jgi:hypothetical protein